MRPLSLFGPLTATGALLSLAGSLAVSCVTPDFDFGEGGSVVYPAHCSNDQLDSGEAALDCGGECAGCEIGSACEEPADCASELCTDGVCEAPRCKVEDEAQLAECGDGGCPAPFADCSGGAADGCETNTATSVEHCGGCDLACATENASGVECVEGACAPACEAGWCAGADPSQGCVEPLGTTTHCAACGEACGGDTPYCTPSGCAAHLPIVLGNSNSIAADPSTQSLSLDLELSYGASDARHRAVLVFVSNQAAETPPTVTFNGKAMPSKGQGNGPLWQGAFYLTDEDLPAKAGTYSVIAKFKDPNGANWGNFVLHAVELTGVQRAVDPGGPLYDEWVGKVSGAPLTTSATLDVPDGAWIYAISSTSNPNVGAPQGGLIEDFQARDDTNRAAVGHLPWGELTEANERTFKLWTFDGTQSYEGLTTAVSLRPATP